MCQHFDIANAGTHAAGVLSRRSTRRRAYPQEAPRAHEERRGQMWRKQLACALLLVAANTQLINLRYLVTQTHAVRLGQHVQI